MASKKTQRDQKKREKKRLKRTQAQKDRGSRPGPTAPRGRGGASIATAAGWEAGPAWISEDWHERGAHVHAVFTRISPSESIVAVAFDVDLRTQTIGKAEVRGGLSPDTLPSFAATRAEDKAMVEVLPGLVAQLVQEAWERCEPGPDFEQVQQLTAGIELDPDTAGFDWGEPEPVKERGGLLGKLIGKLVGP